MRNQLTDAVVDFLSDEQGWSLATWALTLALILGVAAPGVLVFGNSVQARLAHTIHAIVQTLV